MNVCLCACMYGYSRDTQVRVLQGGIRVGVLQIHLKNTHISTRHLNLINLTRFNFQNIICNIPDLETLANTWMQLGLMETLGLISGFFDSKPNLACTYSGIHAITCKCIILVIGTFYWLNNWSRILRVQDGLREFEVKYVKENAR